MPAVDVYAIVVSRKLRGALDESWESTRTLTWRESLVPESPIVKVVSTPGEVSLGRVQPIIWPANCANCGHLTQSVAHRPLTSGVHATERPSPYCHCASIGSPAGDLIISSAFGL